MTSHAAAEYRQQAEHVVAVYEQDDQPGRQQRLTESIAQLLTRQYDQAFVHERGMVLNLHNALTRKERDNRALQDAMARLQDTVATLTSETRSLRESVARLEAQLTSLQSQLALARTGT